jgi:hypothetical protein
MIVRNELELNILDISIVHIHVRQTEIDILIQPDFLELVREVIVVGNREEALGVGGTGDVVNDGVHASEESGSVSLIVLGRRATFALNDGRRFTTSVCGLGRAAVGPYPRGDTFVEG